MEKKLKMVIKRARRRYREEISPEDRRAALIEAWKPKTEIGRKVKAGEITSIEEVLNMGRKNFRV